MNLLAIDWNILSRLGRIYPLNVLGGEDLVYTEIEYPFPLQANRDFFGAVVFANVATASSHKASYRLV